MTSSHETLLRRRAVEARTGLSRSGIYRAMSLGDFPLPVQLAAQTVAWKESDVNAWIASRKPTTQIGRIAPALAKAAKG